LLHHDVPSVFKPNSTARGFLRVRCKAPSGSNIDRAPISQYLDIVPVDGNAKVASGTAEWRVAVPAEGSATLRYRVMVRY